VLTIRESRLRRRIGLATTLPGAVFLVQFGSGAGRPAERVDPVPAHDSFTIQSRALNEGRLVNVYTPPQYRPSRARGAGATSPGQLA
jgi:hypothetical protein